MSSKKSKKSNESKYSSEEKQIDITSQYQSQYCQQYLKQIELIPQGSINYQNILKHLKKNKFDYKKEFSFDFHKKIIMNSRDSVRYQIQYGNFRIYITALYTCFDFSKIKRERIGKGNFGEIFRFAYNKNLIVAKLFYNIRSSSSMDDIIKQVFWAKFASALEIGPKFIQAYGYDLICYKDKYEYLMQECQGNLQQISTSQKNVENYENRLKEIIQILHSFNVIHGDIKLNHFVWSQSYKNIIILDFGMTRFIQEKIGQMTRTEFFGTYSYSSPQMKKAYFLKSAIPVDLFFNDLFALKLCKNRLDKQGLQIVQQSPNFNESQWTYIVNIFKFKFEIFEQNSREIVKMCQKQKQSALFFCQVLKLQKSDNLNQLSQKFWDSLNMILKQKLTPIAQENAYLKQIILMELRKFSCQPVFFKFEITEAFIKKMYERHTLENYLEANESMEALFEFIFQPKELSQAQISEKQTIISYIYLTKNHFKPECASYMTHSVLLLFQDHFYKSGNLEKLEKIRDIFSLTCKIKYLVRINQNICQLFLKNPDLWIEHFKKGIQLAYRGKQNLKRCWQWLIVQLLFTQQFLQKQNKQVISSCINLIKQFDKIMTSWAHQITHENGLHQALNQINKRILRNKAKKAVGKRQAQFDNNQLQNQFQLNQTKKNDFPKIKKKQILYSIQKGDFLVIQGELMIGTIKFTDRPSLVRFYSVFPKINYILHETVWHLVNYFKQNNAQAFQQCLQTNFQDIFVTDMFEGIHMFFIFSNLLGNAITYSSKTQEIVVKYFARIQIRKILYQIKNSIWLLQKLIFEFLEILNTFFRAQFNKKQEAITALDKIYKQIIFFFADNNEEERALNCEIEILLQVIQALFKARKTGFISIIDTMLTLMKKVLEQDNRRQIVFLVSGLVIQIIIQSNCSSYTGSLWKSLKNYSSKSQQFFIILSRRMKIFQMIIYKLCSQDQFEQCFQTLEDYGKVAQSSNDCLNNTQIDIFDYFVEHIPQQMIIQMFIKRLDEYKLQRIRSSCRLSFILLFILQKKQFLLNQSQKIRYIKVISFGLSKMEVRYNKFLQINAYLFSQFRQLIHFKSVRKQILIVKKQARVSHHPQLFYVLANKKKTLCCRVKTSKKLRFILELIIKKIKEQR